MSPAVTIYVASPATKRGLWRVRTQGRPEHEVAGEGAAVDYATAHARMLINSGGAAVVKIERANGSWETLPI